LIVSIGRVDLPELTGVGDVHHEVAGQRRERHPVGLGVDAQDDDRVGVAGGVAGAGVDADDQVVLGFAPGRLGDREVVDPVDALDPDQRVAGDRGTEQAHRHQHDAGDEHEPLRPRAPPPGSGVVVALPRAVASEAAAGGGTAAARADRRAGRGQPAVLVEQHSAAVALGGAPGLAGARHAVGGRWRLAAVGARGPGRLREPTGRRTPATAG
jgi:hypothetical protein